MESIGSFRFLEKSESGSWEYSQPISEMDEIAESNFLFAMVGVIFIFTFLLVVSVAGVTFSLQGLFLIASRLKAGQIGDQKKPHIQRLVSIPKLLRFPKH